MIPNALGFSETLAPIYAAPSTTSSQASFAYQPKKRAGSMQPIKVSPKRSGQEYATSTDGRSEPFAAPADEQQKEQASAASALSTDVKMTADAEEEVLPLEPEEALQEEDGEPDHTVSEHEDQEEDAPACPHPNIHPSSPPIPPAPLLPQPDKVVLVSSSTTSSQAEPTAKPASAEASLPAPPAPVAAPPPSVPVPAPLPAPALVRDSDTPVQEVNLGLTGLLVRDEYGQARGYALVGPDGKSMISLLNSDGTKARDIPLTLAAGQYIAEAQYADPNGNIAVVLVGPGDAKPEVHMYDTTGRMCSEA